METGSSGTFVIPWSQTETDGLKAATPDIVTVGALWRWTGYAVRVDGPQEVLRLEGAEGMAEMRRRASRIVRRLIGTAAGQDRAVPEADPGGDALADQGFVVTDGHHSHRLTPVRVGSTGDLVLLVVGAVPAPDQDFWVVDVAMDRACLQVAERPAGGVICFTPGTRIATPSGPRLIQDLAQGDLVLTRDNGAQAIQWTGFRRMTGARLYAMPHLRPIRLRAGALGPSRPDPDLLVSPQHRMLVRGRAAQALFNVDEVLVTAEDLVNDQTITVERGLREVTYVHVLLDRHNVIWANGLETESFHPAHAALDQLDPVQRQGLFGLFPGLECNPDAYGDPVRRNLSAAEAVLLRHDMQI